MAILTFARQHRLTVYDASYLELAQREAWPLATLDAALRKAATELGIELIDAEP
jgi:predicted nucleic acid-binding protein